MSETLDQIMDFNPSDLNVFNPVEVVATGNGLDWNCNPKGSKNEDGHYHARIRILYNPFDMKSSIVNQTIWSMHDANGYFSAKSVLADGDKNCPIFKAWKRVRYNQDPKIAEFAKGDNAWYEKRETKWVLIQIIEDENVPESVGQLKFWKLPKAVMEKLTAKLNPGPQSKKQPAKVLDYLQGVCLTLDVQPGPDDPKNPERKNREISYSLCDFEDDIQPVIKVDGTPLFDDEQVSVIENYKEAADKVQKAKTAADKEKWTKTATELVPQMKELYNIATEYLKANAPDLVKEHTYQGWGTELTNRINAYIALTDAGKDPSIPSAETATAMATTIAANANGASAVASAPSVDTAGDLPF